MIWFINHATYPFTIHQSILIKYKLFFYALYDIYFLLKIYTILFIQNYIYCLSGWICMIYGISSFNFMAKLCYKLKYVSIYMTNLPL